MDALYPLLNQPWPYLAVAAVAIGIGWYAWRQPHRPGTRYFCLATLLWAASGLCSALMTVFPSVQVRYGLYILLDVFILVLPVLELLIVLKYTGSESWLARRGLLLLFLPALVWVLMNIATPGSFIIVEYFDGIPVIEAREPAKSWFYAYILLLILIRTMVLLACLLRAAAFWAPILLLTLTQIAPLAGYYVADRQSIIVSPIQVVTLLFCFILLAYFVALYSFRFLQVVPVARDQVIARLPYSLIVLDAENRLVDYNAAACALPDLPGRPALHQPASRVLGGWWQRLAPLIATQPLAQDVPVPDGQGRRIFHTISLPLHQASGWHIGQVFLLEDVTRERQEDHLLATLQERERLARELHDSLGQVLGYASFQVDAAARLSRAGQGETAAVQLERLGNVIREAHADVREHILDLRSLPSQQQPFFAAVRQYLEGFTANYEICTKLAVDPSLGEQPFSPEAQPQVFRILQEALSNVRKHSRARHVAVAFTGEPGSLCMAIQDDGCGFSPEAFEKNNGFHFGQRFMRERAEALGGCLEVESLPGAGTRVLLMMEKDLSACSRAL